MKKIIILLIGCLMITRVAISSNGPVTTAGSVTICNTGTVQVPITVTDFGNIGAISLTLNYDPAILQYQGVTLNPAISGSLTNGATPGIFILGYICDPGINLPPDATLFTLNFSYVGPPAGGTSPLTWAETPPEANEYSDPAGIPYNKDPFGTCFINGSVTVYPAVYLAALPVQPVCFSDPGSVTLTASGGTTPYVFAASNPPVTNLAAGSYSYTVTDANGCTATATAVITRPEQVCLQIKVLLQGPYDPSTHMMRDDLRAQGFIPFTEPYSGPPYSSAFTHLGGGGETVTNPAIVFGNNGENAIVDWVFIELRDKSDKTIVQYTRSALVQSDGDVVDVDGVSPVCFRNLSGCEFYIAVRHRNHLGVMTANVKTMTAQGTPVNFTDGSEPEFNWGTGHPVAGPAYNYTGLSQSTPEAGKRALWYGDANSDHRVKYEAGGDDQLVVESNVIVRAGNTSSQSGYDFCQGYYAGDVDMNGKVKYEAPDDDRSLMLYQVLFYPLNSTRQSIFDLMFEQLP